MLACYAMLGFVLALSEKKMLETDGESLTIEA